MQDETDVVEFAPFIMTLLMARRAYGYPAPDEAPSPEQKRRAEFVLSEVFRALHACMCPVSDILETKLARGDIGPDMLGLIDKAFLFVGSKAGVMCPLITAAIIDAKREHP
ncbi:hypothetical protein [Paraburkholderia sediminicola]|uniref:hypothetical protein n=1 Tax=Paraburkholderia sediminicola TaxID=458836 RepID=UPI0038BA943F